MAGQLACAALPLLQETLSLPLLTQIHLLLPVLESPASLVPDSLGSLCGVLGPRAGQWGGEAGVEHPLCTQWYVVPMCPRLLQHENEELRRRLTYVTNKMEAMERELESGQDYLEMELGQNREELEKFKDKFRRYEKENERGRAGEIPLTKDSLSWHKQAVTCWVNQRHAASSERCTLRL